MLPFLMFANRRAGRKSAARRAFYGPMGERQVLGLINEYMSPEIVTDTEEQRQALYQGQLREALIYLLDTVKFSGYGYAAWQLVKSIENVPTETREYLQKIGNDDLSEDTLASERETYDKNMRVLRSQNKHVQEVWHVLDKLTMDAWKQNCFQNGCLNTLYDTYGLPSYLRNVVDQTHITYIALIMVNIVRKFVVERLQQKDSKFHMQQEAKAWTLLGISERLYPLKLVETVLRPKLTIMSLADQQKYLGRRYREEDEEKEGDYDHILPTVSKYARLTANRQRKK